MEKLTTKEKEFIESRLTKIPTLLMDITEILHKNYFEDPYRQKTILLNFLDAAVDLLAPCRCLIEIEDRKNFYYPDDFKSEEV